MANEERTKAVDILLVSYHRPNFTFMTLESIIQRTTTPYRLIVVDNGSRPEQQDRLIEYQREGFIKVLCLLDRNWGLEYAKNTGLRFIESEPYFINTDNDLLIESPTGGTDWLAKMIKLMDDNPKFGAIAARPQIQLGLHNIYQDEVGADGEIIKHLTDDGRVAFYNGGDGPCGGSYRIMRTDLVKKYRWRDEWNDSRSEEWRICGEMNREGYKCGFAKYVRCYHLFGKGNWGYEKGIPHYHAQRDFGDPQDVPFNPVTCVPEVEQY